MNDLNKKIIELMTIKYELEAISASDFRKILKLKGMRLIRSKKIATTDRDIKTAYNEIKKNA